MTDSTYESQPTRPLLSDKRVLEIKFSRGSTGFSLFQKSNDVQVPGRKQGGWYLFAPNRCRGVAIAFFAKICQENGA